MKRAGISVVSLIFLAAPALTLAQSAIPIGPTALQLATRVAALEAQETAIQDGHALACTMLFTSPSAKVGQPIILAWGSVGAVEQMTDVENMRPTNGAVSLLFSAPGTWAYTFKFYDANNTSVTCTANVTVTQ